MISDDKPPQYMTSAELEEAIRRHREHTKKLLAEARSRRAKVNEGPTSSTRTDPTETFD
jgi:hypothetical protein